MQTCMLTYLALNFTIVLTQSIAGNPTASTVIDPTCPTCPVCTESSTVEGRNQIWLYHFQIFVVYPSHETNFGISFTSFSAYINFCLYMLSRTALQNCEHIFIYLL